MAEFSVSLVVEFKTRQKVVKLSRNNKCLLDEFLNEINKDNNLKDELGELFSIIEDAANGLILPKNKYRKLKVSKNLKYKPFEAKTANLRLYLFCERNTGQILVIGGKKTEQDEDIERIERIIKEYTLFKK